MIEIASDCLAQVSSYFQDNAQQLGLHPTQGSFLVGLIGISNTVARLVLGILSQKLNRSVTLQNIPMDTCKF